MRTQPTLATASILLVVAAITLGSNLSPIRPVCAESKADTPIAFSEIVVGIRSRIESIRSGGVTIRGTKVDVRDQEKYQGPVEILCAFADGFEKVRFERSEFEVWADTSDSPNPRYAKPMSTRYFRTKELSGIYFADSRQTQLRAPDERHNPFVNPFDPRCVGLLFESDRQQCFDEVMRFPLSREPSNIFVEADGSVCLEWPLNSNFGDARERLWVDIQRGCTPVRFELQRREMRQKGREVWEPPSLVTTTSWKEVDGIWLPSTCRMESTSTGGRKRAHDLQFEWRLVNETLPDELFGAEDMTPPGSIIIDCRENPAVIVRQPR